VTFDGARSAMIALQSSGQVLQVPALWMFIYKLLLHHKKNQQATNEPLAL
jgi:hypothetical protein